MKQNKKQKHKQNETIKIDFNNSSNIEKTKYFFLFDLAVRLFKALYPFDKHYMPYFFEGYGLLTLHLKGEEMAGKKVGTLPFSYDTLPAIETKTPKEIFTDIDKTLSRIDVYDKNNMDICLKCVMSLLYLKSKKNKMTDDENDSFAFMEYYIIARSFEALGYKTKIQHTTNVNKINWEKQQKEAEIHKEAIRQVLEEMNITTSLLSVFKSDKMKRDNFDKKAQEKTGLSQKRIRDIARDILKEQNKTHTRH